MCFLKPIYLFLGHLCCIYPTRQIHQDICMTHTHVVQVNQGIRMWQESIRVLHDRFLPYPNTGEENRIQDLGEQSYKSCTNNQTPWWVSHHTLRTLIKWLWSSNCTHGKFFILLHFLPFEIKEFTLLLFFFAPNMHSYRFCGKNKNKKILQV